MKIFIATIVAASLLPAVTLLSAGDAAAQATCRQKCTDEESACLKRTNNKSQCGDRARTCMAKCK